MNKKVYTPILIIGLIILALIIFKKDKWNGYFYPDASNLSDWVESDEVFDSLEQCRFWAEDTGYQMNIEPISYDYECGLNCKYKNGFNVCEKTLN